MKGQNAFGAAVLMMIFFATDGEAQTHSDEPVFRPTVFAPEVKEADLKTELAAPLRIEKKHDAKPLSAVRFHKTQFLILSAAVYGASLADMHQTLRERKYSWWFCEAAHARLLRHRTGAGHGPELDQLENGAFEKMAQAGSHSATAGNWRQHLRLPEQSFPMRRKRKAGCELGEVFWGEARITARPRKLATLIHPQNQLPHGATTSFHFDFTCTVERLEASQPPPSALISRTLVTSRCP